MSKNADIKKLITTHNLRLQILKEQQAKMGISVEPKILIEIEEIEAEIEKLELDLNHLGNERFSELTKQIEHNLPGRWEFVNRHLIREEFRQALESDTARVIVIDAPGGMGKSALALEIAYEYLEKSKSAQMAQPFKAFIWISDRDISINLVTLIDHIARQFGELYIAQSPDLEYKQQQIISLLAKNKTFLIVDNFETIEDENLLPFLLRIPEPSKIIITSRRRIETSSWSLSLGSLDRKDAKELMKLRARRLSISGFDVVPEEILDQLYDVTGGSPLAIMWAIGQIKQKGQTLDVIIEGLNRASSQIFNYLFNQAWILLTEDAKQIIKAIAVYPQSISYNLLSASIGLPESRFREGVSQLVEMWLIEGTSILSIDQSRYFLHPLTKAFILAELAKSPAEKIQTYERAINILYELTKSHGGLVPSVSDYEIVQQELNNIVGLTGWCQTNVSDVSESAIRNCIKSVELISVFMWGRGYWNERIKLGMQAYEMAKFLGLYREIGWQASSVAWIKYWQNDIEPAEEWTWLSLKAMQRTDLPNNLSFGYKLLGLIYTVKKDYELARIYLVTSLGLVSENSLGVESKRAIHCDLGLLAYESKNYIESEQWLQRAVDDAVEKRDEEGQSINKSLLARTIINLEDRLNDAISLYQDALALASKFKRKVTIARCEFGLAEAEFARNNLFQAATHLQEAEKLFNQLGMKRDLDLCKTLSSKLN